MPMDTTMVIALEGLYQYIITTIIHWIITSDNFLIFSLSLCNFSQLSHTQSKIT
jgi:hypothetical protein